MPRANRFRPFFPFDGAWALACGAALSAHGCTAASPAEPTPSATEPADSSLASTGATTSGRPGTDSLATPNEQGSAQPLAAFADNASDSATPIDGSPETPAEPEQVLIDDFSDGDATLSAPGFVGAWETYSDGTGEVTPAEGTPIVPTAGVIDVSGSGFGDWGVGLRVQFNTPPGSEMRPGVVALTDYRGVAIRAAGSGVVQVELVTVATTGVEEGGSCTGDNCFGHFAAPLLLSEQTEEQLLEFASFAQPSWAQAATLDLSQVIGLNLLARAEGTPVAVDLSLDRLALLNPLPAASAPTSVPAPGVLDEGNPFRGTSLHSRADQALSAYNAASGAERDLLAKVALQPTAFWLNGGDPTRAGAIVDDGGDDYTVLVAYNIPDRDCSGESAGGASSAAEYQGWIDGMAGSLAGKRAAVVLEPDALALSCGESTESLIAYAVNRLRQNPEVAVYIDGGHSNWVSAGQMAGRLMSAGIAQATGFAINVSNFQPTANLINYGHQLSGLVGGKPFIVDTSRNGQGPRGAEWCNPQGTGLGEAPTTATGDPAVHALLWIKRPGESDGQCGQCTAVRAGQFCTAYALELARNSAF